jgi:hypothetical protein
MSAPGVDPDLFVHIRVLVGMVVSLGLARVLAGMAGFIQHPKRARPYWIHIVWSVAMLLALVHFWWWEYRLALLPVWHFHTYAFVVCYAILYFVLCALLYPDNVNEYDGWRGYFLSRRTWFFGLLALSFLVDIVDTTIKGPDRLAALGIEYPLRAVVCVALCALAMVVRNERFHAAFAVGSLLYQLSWAVRIFDSVR